MNMKLPFEASFTSLILKVNYIKAKLLHSNKLTSYKCRVRCAGLNHIYSLVTERR